MKNLILTSVFILSYLFQLQAGNAPETSKLIVIQNEKSLILNSTGLSAETKVFKITDAKGDIIFTDIVEKNKQKVKYDLRSLPNDNYNITVDGYNVATVYEAVISDESVMVEEIRTYYRPTIQSLEEKVVVSAALENKENIQISIYDHTNGLVFRHKIEKENNFNLPINLKRLSKGEYEVVVSTEHFIEQSKITL